MSAETIPSEVATDLDCIRWYVECLDAVAFKRRAVAGLAEAEGSYNAAMKRLTDRSTRPAEPAAPVAEAGEVVAWGVEMYGFWELCNDEETARYRHEPARKVEPLVRHSTLEAERARADAAEQCAADALARVKELEFGAGFETAFDAVVRPGSRYENWTPADDPAEIVTDLYNDLEDALARAEKAEDWQPIETAPKDGTPLDLWSSEFGRHTDCHWGKPQHCCGEAGRYCDSDWHTEPEGWVDGVLNVILSDPEEFTHWRPLPAPPRDLSQGGQHG